MKPESVLAPVSTLGRRLLCVFSCAIALGCSSMKSKDGNNELSDGLEAQMNSYIRRVRSGQVETLSLDLLQLCAFGRHASGPVKEQLLTSEDPRVRSNAVYVLSEIFRLDGDETAMESVREAMNDREPTVRLEAARALLEIGDRRGVPELIQGLRSPARSTRINSFHALAAATRDSFGYNPDDSSDRREQAVVRFEGWHRSS